MRSLRRPWIISTHCTPPEWNFPQQITGKINNNSSSNNIWLFHGWRKTTNGAPWKLSSDVGINVRNTRVRKRNEIVSKGETETRKINRSHTGYSIKEICEKILSYEANKSVDNGTARKFWAFKNSKIYPESNILSAPNDDTVEKNEQTDLQLLIREFMRKRYLGRIEFTSWKKFPRIWFYMYRWRFLVINRENSIAF